MTRAIHGRAARPIVLATGAMLACIAAPVPAQSDYPNRPLRFVVPLAAGGGTDILARMFGQKFSDAFNQQVVIDNRPGAGGVIGGEIAARAAPDGYTLVMVSSAHTIQPALHRKLPFDPVKDFAPVSMVARYPLLLLAHPALGVKSVGELLTAAKAKPGQIAYASSGNGSAAHLSAELLKSMAGIDLVHVPYKGSGPAVIALVGGQTPIGFYSVSAAKTHVRAGRLRALGVTGAARSPGEPDIPTIAESGVPGYEAVTWGGVLMPAGTPRAIISRIHAELVRALKQPDVLERLAAMDFEPVGDTPEQFARTIQTEIVKWGKVVRASGARVD